MEQTLEYSKGAWWKRLFAFLFDFCCAALLAAAFSAGGEAIVEKSPIYSDARSTMAKVEASSGLYIQDGSTLKLLSDYYSAQNNSSEINDSVYQSQNETYESALSGFYANTAFFPTGQGVALYAELKTAIILHEGTPYFEYQKVGSENQIVVKAGVDAKTLNGFYLTCIDEYAQPELGNRSDGYLQASRVIFWSTILVVYSVSLLSLFLFFAIVPLFFRRGWQTFGLKLFHLSVISANALNPSRACYWGRAFFEFFIEFVLSSVAFLIPLAVSFSMMVLRKDGQAFHDYISGTYVVDTSDRVVYLSEKEYLERENKLDQLSFKDFNK